MVNFHSFQQKAYQVGHTALSWANTSYQTINQVIAGIWKGTVTDGICSTNFYKYRIAPITEKEEKILSVTAAVSVVASAIALGTLGFIAFPLVLAGDSLVITGCYGLIPYRRLTKEYNEQAWEQLDLLRKHIYHHTSPKNQEVKKIQEYVEIVKKPQYVHIEDEIKKLEETIQKYKSVLTSNNEDTRNNFAEHRDSLVQYIEGVQAKLSLKEIDPLVKKKADKDGKKEANSKDHEGDLVEVDLEEVK